MHPTGRTVAHPPTSASVSAQSSAATGRLVTGPHLTRRRTRLPGPVQAVVPGVDAWACAWQRGPRQTPPRHRRTTAGRPPCHGASFRPNSVITVGDRAYPVVPSPRPRPSSTERTTSDPRSDAPRRRVDDAADARGVGSCDSSAATAPGPSAPPTSTSPGSAKVRQRTDCSPHRPTTCRDREGVGDGPSCERSVRDRPVSGRRATRCGGHSTAPSTWCVTRRDQRTGGESARCRVTHHRRPARAGDHDATLVLAPPCPGRDGIS